MRSFFAPRILSLSSTSGPETHQAALRPGVFALRAPHITLLPFRDGHDDFEGLVALLAHELVVRHGTSLVLSSSLPGNVYPRGNGKAMARRRGVRPAAGQYGVYRAGRYWALTAGAFLSAATHWL